MANSKPPVKVSSLIKVSRYSFLICGILYGSSRRKFLIRYDAKHKLIRDKKQKERIANEKRESKYINTCFFRDMAGIIGVDLPPDWQAPE